MKRIMLLAGAVALAVSFTSAFAQDTGKAKAPRQAAHGGLASSAPSRRTQRACTARSAQKFRNKCKRDAGKAAQGQVAGMLPLSIWRARALGACGAAAGAARLPLQERLHALARQLVGPLVLGVAGVTAHPMPFHLVALLRRVEPLPQLDVLDRRARRRPPALALPAVDPRADALLHVLGVGVKIDARGLGERFERRDRRHQLHAVVGGRCFPAGQLLAMAVRRSGWRPSRRAQGSSRRRRR